MDWEKLGFETRFMVLVECKSREEFHRLERRHVLITEEYRKKHGGVVMFSAMFGNVLLEEVATHYDKAGVIVGYSTGKEAAKFYAEVYLKQLHPEISTRLFLLRNATIQNFFIQEEFLESYMEVIDLTEEDKEFIKKIREELREQ